MFLRFFVIFLFLFCPAYSFGQNLLLNGDFEEENICTEYKVNCAPEAWICNSDGFNNYFRDDRRAHSGSHFMAIEAGFSFKPFQRTYIRSPLLCGLRKGHQYRLEFFVRSRHSILDSIGVIFTSFDFLFGQKRLQNLSPSLFIKSAKGSFVKDSTWQKVSIDYTAKGDESFITIANFSRKDINSETGIPMEKHFFVFLDDFSLMPLDPHEHLCAGWEANKQSIYDQDERHEYLRQLIRLHKDNPPLVVHPPTIISVIDTLVVPDVLFASGKADLQKQSYSMLDDFCKKLSGKKIDSIVVEGHTDNIGTLAMNEKLSLDRANAVQVAIRQRLTSLRSAIITRGWADRKPLADNSTAAGRQENRRVEMFVYTRE
jgi:outer membrane protein OmpA-like peptidoglycan-associated protein